MIRARIIQKLGPSLPSEFQKRMGSRLVLYKTCSDKPSSEINSHSRKVCLKYKFCNMWAILAPVIAKPKVEICCLALVFYNKNFLRREKIKSKKVQGILKFGNFCEFLRFFETFQLVFVFFFTKFCPKKVFLIQNQISRYIYEVQFLIQSNQKIITAKFLKIACQATMEIFANFVA